MRRSKYQDIGRNGSAERLLWAFEKAGNSWHAPSITDLITDAAIEAFHEGRPQNFQTILQNVKSLQSVKVYNGIYTEDFSAGYPRFLARNLGKLLEKSKDRQRDLGIALETVSVVQKRSILNHALKHAVGDADETFVTALLEAGADVNAKFEGFPGFIFASAICYAAPDVVQALYKHGGDFGAAHELMVAKDYGSDAIAKLEFYKNKLAGPQAQAAVNQSIAPDMAAKILEKLEQMQQQITDLTRRVDAALGEKSDDPQPTARSARKPYPSVG